MMVSASARCGMYGVNPTCISPSSIACNVWNERRQQIDGDGDRDAGGGAGEDGLEDMSLDFQCNLMIFLHSCAVKR